MLILLKNVWQRRKIFERNRWFLYTMFRIHISNLDEESMYVYQKNNKEFYESDDLLKTINNKTIDIDKYQVNYIKSSFEKFKEPRGLFLS